MQHSPLRTSAREANKEVAASRERERERKLIVYFCLHQFVELKGSVFKKFEKNNLFQMACSGMLKYGCYILRIYSLLVERTLVKFLFSFCRYKRTISLFDFSNNCNASELDRI